jgi:anti-sigma regulatory factor (Ser/Thr protein kinase)
MVGDPTQSAERTFELELPSRPGSVSDARHAVGEFIGRLGMPDADIRLAVSETVGNAVTHAFRGREPGIVRITCSVYERALLVTVADDGTGMRPNLDSPGLGLGIPLITKLATDVRFDSSERGTTVSMSFAR